MLSIVRSLSGGMLTSDGSMIAVWLDRMRHKRGDSSKKKGREGEVRRVREEEETEVRKQEDGTKMITYLCPLQAPPSPHLELAGSSGSEKLQTRKSHRKLGEELQERP